MPRLNISNYQQLARKAKQELATDPRQAAEKAYLAAVHASRMILECSEMPSGRAGYRSSAAIGRASDILIQKLGKADPQANKLRTAFGNALGAHTSCFYEGVCVPENIRKVVLGVVQATHTVENVCRRIKPSR